MTISAPSVSSGNFGDNTTSVTLGSTISVTAGQLVIVAGMKYSPSADAFVAGDCTQTAGTATLDTFQLDQQAGGDCGDVSSYNYTAKWSALVTASGTLNVTVGGAASGSFLLMCVDAHDGNWDANRLVGGNGSLNTGDAITSIATGTVVSSVDALYHSCLAINDNQTQSITNSSSFTQTYTEQSNSHGLGASGYRIVSGGGTVGCTWAFTALNNLPGNGASAVVVAYKEAASTGNSVAWIRA